MPVATNLTAATTRAAWVPLHQLPPKTSATVFVSDLRSRGYNTVVIPLMQEGLFHARRSERGPRARLAGPLGDALTGALAQKRTSVWLAIDPLAAGPKGTSDLGRLANDHREWLMRNTQGRLLPIGNEEHDPIYSWMNITYRRFMGDHLVALAESYPVSGLIIDMRRYPGTSSDEGRWYCCSFESQTRAELALRIGFERLLYEGTQRDIRRWQRWVVRELSMFIENIVARVRAARRDMTMTLLVPPFSSETDDFAPYLETAGNGLIDELVIDFTHTEPQELSRQISIADEACGRTIPILPAWRDEDEMGEAGPVFLASPSSGYLVMKPDTDPEPAMPDRTVRWGLGGALEDNPAEAAAAIAYYAAEELGEDHPCSATLLKLAEDLNKGTLGTTEQVRKEIRRIENTCTTEEDGKLKHLTVELDLLRRLMEIVKSPAQVY